MSRPESPSCDRNQEPISNELKRLLVDCTSCLEIGSGTGQHATYFTQQLPTLSWTCSDVKENHAGIKSWICDQENIKGPLQYKIGEDTFPEGSFDCVFSANSLHIMSWKTAKTLFKTLGKNCSSNTFVIFYGPFNLKGDFTSVSNKNFDRFLKERDPAQGIRSLEDVSNNMAKNGFFLQEDIEMPSNNRLLVFKN